MQYNRREFHSLSAAGVTATILPTEPRVLADETHNPILDSAAILRLLSWHDYLTSKLNLIESRLISKIG